MAWKKIVTGGKILSKWFLWKIFFIFLVILALNIIIISVQEKSIVPAVKEIGGRLVYPTLRIQEYSERAIEQGGLYERDEGNFYRGIGNWFLRSSAFLISFYSIFLWMKMFYWLFGKLSNINPVINLLLAICLFFIIQIMFLLVFTPESVSTMSKPQLIMIPLKSFGSFFRAIPYLFKPIIDTAKNVIGDVQNMSSDLNNSL